MSEIQVKPNRFADTSDVESVEAFEQASQEFDKSANEVAERTRAARAVALQESANVIAQAAKIDDIVERAKAIAGEVQFEDITKKRIGDMFIAVPKATDTNKVAVLDYLFKDAGKNKPHFNQFIGRIVDHRGVILDDFYDGLDFLNAFNAVGLRELKVKEILEAVRIYALRHRWNDLTERVDSLIPQWDGVVRMPHALVNMFESRDTELNRDFGMYFWLSLYTRLMHPGEEAPIILTLVGAQNCGKSYFGKLVSRLITGDAEADSVQLDLGADKTNFLREITGVSICAAVGEMTGFSKADLSRVKDFVTRTSDRFSYKFEGNLTVPRQWITVMDANKYEGLLRDDTGNRRFYPMFCGQLDDRNGKQCWREDFKANVDSLKTDLWQLLAEARAWLDVHGIDGYRDMVRQVSKSVFAFSHEEMKSGRGGMKDDNVRPYFAAAMSTLEPRTLKKHNSGKIVLFYDRDEMIKAVLNAAGSAQLKTDRSFMRDLEKECARFDGELTRMNAKSESGIARGKLPGFEFPFNTADEFLTAIDRANGDDGEHDIEVDERGNPINAQKANSGRRAIQQSGGF